jgi:hypothetical protein
LRNYEIALEDNYGRTLEKLVESIKSGKKTAIFLIGQTRSTHFLRFGSGLKSKQARKERFLTLQRCVLARPS